MRINSRILNQQLCVSLGWNIAEFITICVNKRSIHPGAHVGLDLIIWMGLLSSAVIQLVLDYWYPTAVAAGSIKIVSRCVTLSIICVLPLIHIVHGNVN